MSLRSLTTCSYVSDATSFAMRHCTIVVTPLPMFPEPDSFRPREIHHRPNASCLGNEKKSPCRWWLIDGCKSLFNVKPSTVPTRLIPELYAHTRTAHPERFLRAEKSRRPNTQHQMGTPSNSITTSPWYDRTGCPKPTSTSQHTTEQPTCQAKPANPHAGRARCAKPRA